MKYSGFLTLNKMSKINLKHKADTLNKYGVKCTPILEHTVIDLDYSPTQLKAIAEEQGLTEDEFMKKIDIETASLFSDKKETPLIDDKTIDVEDKPIKSQSKSKKND